METRYVTPYFSSIKLVLFPGVASVAVKDQQGRDGVSLVEERPQIKTHLTGWLNNQVVRSDEFVFEAGKTPSMESVLARAKQMGVDVVEILQEVFDAVAEQFPQTAEQAAGAESSGPAVYLRPDSFECNLDPGTRKSLQIKVGVYGEAEFQKVQTYIRLVFEDGETKRQRLANIADLQAAKTQVTDNLTALRALIALKQSGGSIPSGVYSEYHVSMATDQLVALERQTAGELAMRVKQIAELQQVLNGDLATLLGDPTAENATPLQIKVSQMVGALCPAILLQLKETNPDYANIDVAGIMAKFAIPDVS